MRASYDCLDFISVVFRSACELVFFFKQKTAYELRISDWSSDVCSSDLGFAHYLIVRADADDGIDGAHVGLYAAADEGELFVEWAGDGGARPPVGLRGSVGQALVPERRRLRGAAGGGDLPIDRKSVVSGKGASVRVNLGCRRRIKKQTKRNI